MGSFLPVGGGPPWSSLSGPARTETACGLKKNKHDSPFPAESCDHSARSWLFAAMPDGVQQGPEGPSLKAQGLAVCVCVWGGVLQHRHSFPRSLPLPGLALVLSVNLISAHLFLPFELLLLNYYRARDPPARCQVSTVCQGQVNSSVISRASLPHPVSQ